MVRRKSPEKVWDVSRAEARSTSQPRARRGGWGVPTTRGRGGGSYKFGAARAFFGGRLRGHELYSRSCSPRKARGCIVNRASARDLAAAIASTGKTTPPPASRSIL